MLFRSRLLLALPALLLPSLAQAQTAIPGALDRAFGAAGGTGGQGMTLSLQFLVMMGLLTLLPGLLLMMTSFTRILVVLSILRQAMGLQQSPPNQVLIGLSLFLSLFIMAPTLDRVNANAIAPYAAGTLNAEQAIAAGGGCAWAGTLAYAVGQKLVPGRSASRVLWSHLAGEVAKISVALGLLFWGLSADRGFAAGPFLAGFIVALLAFPLAMPLLKK